MIYNWNIANWKNLLLPPRKRNKQRLGDVFLSLLESMQVLYTGFMVFRQAMLYRLRWNSQTIYLELLLNDRFNNGAPAFIDFELRLLPIGIYIANPATFKEQIYRWNAIENRHQAARYNAAELAAMLPTDPRRKYRYNESELGANLDFVVMVPIALFDVTAPSNQNIVANMRAWIELYRIAGSRYTIENY